MSLTRRTAWSSPPVPLLESKKNDTFDHYLTPLVYITNFQESPGCSILGVVQHAGPIFSPPMII